MTYLFRLVESAAESIAAFAAKAFGTQERAERRLRSRLAADPERLRSRLTSDRRMAFYFVREREGGPIVGIGSPYCDSGRHHKGEDRPERAIPPCGGGRAGFRLSSPQPQLAETLPLGGSAGRSCADEAFPDRSREKGKKMTEEYTITTTIPGSADGTIPDETLTAIVPCDGSPGTRAESLRENIREMIAAEIALAVEGWALVENMGAQVPPWKLDLSLSDAGSTSAYRRG